jgi:hypothetical protein
LAARCLAVRTVRVWMRGMAYVKKGGAEWIDGNRNPVERVSLPVGMHRMLGQLPEGVVCVERAILSAASPIW